MTDNPYAAPQSAVADSAAADAAPTPASRLRRLGANLIDMLMLMAVFMALVFVYAIVSGDELEWFNVDSYWVGLLARLLIFTTFVLLNLVPMREGRTVGKQMLGLRVLAADGRPASLGQQLGRYWIMMFLGSLGLSVVGLIDVLFIFRASQKCLHDDICSTQVVRD